MCGRARCTLRPDNISRAVRIDGSLRSLDMDRYRPSYNVSPGSHLPVVMREDALDGQGACLHCMKWGLIPSFTKKTEKPDHYKMFNARSESVSEKASFRRLIPNNRCLVVVEGFYEWKKDGSRKQPYYIHIKDGRPLVFAALYDSWKNSEGEGLYTFTILTTSSASALQWLHDRMPVILGDKESTDAWLYGSSSTKFDMLLKPYESPELVWYPVTPAMGKPSFDGLECIKQIQLKTEKENQILRFFSGKGDNNDKDSKPKDKCSSNESSKTDLLKFVKDELKTEDETGISSPVAEGNAESNVSIPPHERATKCQIKQDYEELISDAKPATGKFDKLCTSPAKKKQKVGMKTSTDKQPKLTAYFRKR